MAEEAGENSDESEVEELEGSDNDGSEETVSESSGAEEAVQITKGKQIKTKTAQEDRDGTSSQEDEEKQEINTTEIVIDGEGNDVSSDDESDDEDDDREDSVVESSSDEKEMAENSDIPLNKKSNEEQNEEKSGWADAMAKVLNMGKNTAQADPNKPLFLSKAIKDHETSQRIANKKENEVCKSDSKDGKEQTIK